ncbi:N-6 DNA methylase [Chryseobacterium sp. Leaf201]|uniref:N-6 DNA methylase n=1 Tax=Chryseobacterium sp. Leaf201 TaxID=1735672 RepID=UPI0006FC0146|nr:N-6 DNA methylase [Chryseobacterium sp. Leaf201]KQM56835.1 type I restriction endonuclease subunit M [Chryseobacterium sp. Leaf201]
MTNIRTETETVIKKILPYLSRRGYDLEKDFDFESAVSQTDRYTKGYIDVLVTLGKNKPIFLIEAKRISKNLTAKDKDQAMKYAKSNEINVPFFIVTNGNDIQCYNTKNGNRINWDGKSVDKIPTKEQLKLVVRTLKSNPDLSNIPLSDDKSLPFRPGLPLRQLNALFYKCHSTIRKIEKNEESAFSDFSKLLFLKLLEEKCDVEADFDLPYSYRFHELAAKPANESDQVRDSVLSMIDSIVKRTNYGEVLHEKIKLKNPKTFHSIVKDLSSVSFYDSSLDSKGAAFEYFVRATLKGKKLGQYFTPRELVQAMTALVGRKKIVNSIISGSRIKVLDPACGTGGFLVYLLQDSINLLFDKLKLREINKATFDQSIKKLKEEIFFGSDANEGVAASAKMNMIIAGDGHTNIQNEDSLSINSINWSTNSPDCTLIMTNPPFGTSEGESLNNNDMQQFEVSSSKGQYLFIQKMITSTIAGGEICTVIDEGVLNTDSGKNLREFILKNCKLICVVSLPNETFKPNKINVKCSLLYLEKRDHPDFDLEDNYTTTICRFDSLGYHASGDKIRNFKKDLFLSEIESKVLDCNLGSIREGYNWSAFDVDIKDIYDDETHRFDYKYWNVDTREKIDILLKFKNPTLKELNLISTSRGKSPSADSYVDEQDGYAIVIKAGSNISKFGKIITTNADWIEKSVYDEFLEKSIETNTNINIIRKYDILLSSTGDGTLGKCCVFDLDIPAIADGHVTIIRVEKETINPYYLADFLRLGFGSVQISRFYTGSTGLIELTPEQVDRIIVDIQSNDVVKQSDLSIKIREIENTYIQKIEEAENILQQSKNIL